MRINTNAAAMNTYGRLTSANSAKSDSLSKLSSGLRINKAGDDAAGLSISEKMKSQIGGLKQATRNAQDGISLIQTAEGALNETHAILGRMRDLATQGANGTLSNDDREALNKEFGELATEITRIAETTEFNTKTLLDKDQSFTFQIGANGNQVMNVKVGSMDAKSLGIDGVALADTAKADGSKSEALTKYEIAKSNLDITTEQFGNASKDLKDANEKLNAAKIKFETNEDVKDHKENLALKTAAEAALQAHIDGGGTAVDTEGALLTQKVTDADGAVTATKGKFDAEETKLNGVKTATETIKGEFDVLEKSLTSMKTAYSEAQLEIESIGREASDKAIKTIDSAIAKVSAQRSDLGAAQNRLGHTINNLNTTQENLTEANSRIRDVDMAEEMMTFTKNNILSQAATSMLSQANAMPNSVLGLLQG